MTRLRAIFLLLLSLACVATRVGAAPGDVLSAAIETNGWVLDLSIDGMATNGFYNFGLGTNNALTGSEKIVVTITSLGFDDSANLIQVPRTVYGTLALRLPYPNSVAKDQTITNGVLINKVVLSDYVYAKDSNIVVQVGAGYYRSSGITNNGAVLAVANNSFLSYQKPIANWTWPSWGRITGSAFQLRATGFHQSAQHGRPLRLMRFRSQDAHGHIVTNDVTDMSIDYATGDSLPFGEYIAAVSSSTLTQGDVITNSFQAFPWIGDAPLDSADGKNIQPTPLYSVQTILNDKAGQYGSTVAVVSQAGSDAAGMAIDSASFNPSVPSAPFATIAAAAAAIANTNLTLHGHKDLGGGIIYLRNGAYGWLGASGKNFGLSANTSVEVATFPGDSPATITGVVGQTTLGANVRLYNLNINSASAATFNAESTLWIDHCTINSTSASLVYNTPIWNVTRSTIVQMTQGLIPFSTQNAAPALIRGNTITGLQNGCYDYTVCGNTFNESMSGLYIMTDPVTKKIPYAEGAILYNNAFYRVSNATGGVYESYYNSFSNGIAIVQNVMECTTNGSRQFFTISGESATNDPVNNVIMWHNTIVGKGCDLAYNNTVSYSVQRLFWSVKNNVFDKLNIKSDTGTSPNSNRTGDWSELFGVSYSGNFNANTFAITGAGNFNPEFLGLWSFQPTAGSTSATAFFQFVNPQSYNGISFAGQGDYHFQSTSPISWLSYESVLPFDMTGHVRSGANAPGAFALSSSQLVGLTLTPQSSAPGSFVVSNSVVGSMNVVQRTADLTTWNNILTNTATTAAWTFADTNNTGGPTRFYRVQVADPQ